jgi:hypothetical protein
VPPGPNRHDHWAAFRDAHRADDARSDLPPAIWEREPRLQRFLSAGTVDAFPTTIDHLSNDQFLHLEELVNAFYLDLPDFCGFTAFLKARRARFG